MKWFINDFCQAPSAKKSSRGSQIFIMALITLKNCSLLLKVRILPERDCFVDECTDENNVLDSFTQEAQVEFDVPSTPFFKGYQSDLNYFHIWQTLQICHPRQNF